MSRVIDTPAGPVYFSPVPAHSLEPGDMFFDAEPAEGMTPWRAYSVRYSRRSLVWMCAEDAAGARYELSFRLNEPVWRVVGARAARAL